MKRWGGIDSNEYYEILKKILRKLSADYRIEFYNGEGHSQILSYGSKNKIRILISESTKEEGNYDMVINNKELEQIQEIFDWVSY